MFRPQAQAETHSRPGEALLGSRTTHAEAHSKLRGSPLASASGTYFFLFIYRLQAQAHSNRVGSPRASRFMSELIFLFFIFRLQAQARAVAQQQRTRGGFRQFFIDSLENVGYLNESTKGIYVKKRS